MMARGSAVRLALGGVALVAVAAQTLPLRGADTAPPTAERIHEVKRGDTLTAIAKKYGVSLGAIVAANRLDEDAVLRVGQRLVIPPPGAAAPVGSAPRTPMARRRTPPRVPANFFMAVPDFGDAFPMLAWPVEGPVSSPFGRRRSGWHRGIDIKADLGVPILASAPGVVMASGYEVRYGRVVKIEHANGFMTVYAHNDQNFVDIGERVTTGYLIASIGRTGRATAHHLHFEVRRDGTVYNPLYLLPMPPRVARMEESDEEGPDEGDE